MFKYAILGDSEVVITSHYGKYEGAEADEAMLAILETMSLAEKDRIKVVIQDYSRVREMTLNDTDMARTSIFRSKLIEHFSVEKVSVLMSKIVLYFVRPTRPDVLAMHLERTERAHKPYGAEFSYLVSGSLSSALQEVGVNELPSDEEWLNPPNSDSD